MAYIDSELSQIPPKSKSVLIHEVITELGISFGETEMFRSLTRHIRDKWHTVRGFVTRNLIKFVSLMNEAQRTHPVNSERARRLFCVEVRMAM